MSSSSVSEEYDDASSLSMGRGEVEEPYGRLIGGPGWRMNVQLGEMWERRREGEESGRGGAETFHRESEALRRAWLLDTDRTGLRELSLARFDEEPELIEERPLVEAGASEWRRESWGQRVWERRDELRRGKVACEDESKAIRLGELDRLRFSSFSSWGSIADRLKFSHPCWILTLARASLFWSSRVNWREVSN